MKKSTLLKVMSIIAIVFGAIGIIYELVSVVPYMGLLSLLGGTFTFAVIIEIIFSILLLVAGIFGLVSQNIKAIATMGLVLIVLKIVDMILCITLGMFTPMLIIGFIIPILYYVGAKMSVQ